MPALDNTTKTTAVDSTTEERAAYLSEARRAYRVLKIGVVATLVLCCAIPVSLNIVDPDLWGHVQYGQDWLADGTMHRTATHTYAAVDYPWINHENAAELLFATGYQQLGIYPLIALKCLLGLSLVATMVWTARRHGVNLLAAWALMLLVAANLQAFFPLRPQLLSFALFSVLMVCLDRAFAAWHAEGKLSFRWLLPLPVIFAVWVNSHGAFVAGLAVVGALLMGRMVEAWLRDGKQSLKVQLQLAAIGLSCLAATFVNPYGLEFHRWLLASLGEPRPEITEWAAATPQDPVFWPFVTLVAVVVACLWATRQRRDWPQIVVLALVGWQAASHLRHIAFFALLAGFWLPVHFQSALARLRPSGEHKLPVMLPSRRLQGLIGLLIVAAITLQSFALADRLSNFHVDRKTYPVDAIQYMVDHGVQGRLVVNFNWAQYAIAALEPHSTVGFDGRFRTCYPQEVVDMHFDFILGKHGGNRHRSEASGSIEQNEQKVLEYGGPEIVLIDRTYANALRVMEEACREEQPQWTRLYRDQTAEVWGKTERFADPASKDFISPEQRFDDQSPRPGAFDWPALPDYSLYERSKELRTERVSDDETLATASGA